MKPVLTIGRNCADWVHYVSQYPKEDSDGTSLEQSWERGGNASNNASVLASLGAPVEFLGTIANDHLKEFFLKDMDSYGIKYDNCPIMDSCSSPATCAICSLETGSRTLLHSRGTLPELSYDQFESMNLNLNNYGWIHFEGCRNVSQIIQMLIDVQAYNTLNEGDPIKNLDFLEPNYKKRKLPISIELEKRNETLAMLPYADVAFIGKEFAATVGATDPITAAEICCNFVTNGTLIICPWGEQGATFTIAGNSADKITKVEAFPPEKIMDSLGAGDTFNASVIYALINNALAEDGVKFGCKIAGAKLGFRGFRKISELPPLGSS